MQAITGFTLHILARDVSMSTPGPWLFESRDNDLENESAPVLTWVPMQLPFISVHTPNCYHIDVTFPPNILT